MTKSISDGLVNPEDQKQKDEQEAGTQRPGSPISSSPSTQDLQGSLTPTSEYLSASMEEKALEAAQSLKMTKELEHLIIYSLPGETIGGKDLIAFASGEGMKLEGVDPILWAREHERLIEGRDPIQWAALNDVKIDNQNAIVWALEQRQQMGGKDPIAFAVNHKMQIEKQDPIAWAAFNEKRIDGETPIHWAAKNSKQIEGKDPVEWSAEKDNQDQKMSDQLSSIASDFAKQLTEDKLSKKEVSEKDVTIFYDKALDALKNGKYLTDNDISRIKSSPEHIKNIQDTARLLETAIPDLKTSDKILYKVAKFSEKLGFSGVSNYIKKKISLDSLKKIDGLEKAISSSMKIGEILLKEGTLSTKRINKIQDQVKSQQKLHQSDKGR